MGDDLQQPDDRLERVFRDLYLGDGNPPLVQRVAVGEEKMKVLERDIAAGFHRIEAKIDARDRLFMWLFAPILASVIGIIVLLLTRGIP